MIRRLKDYFHAHPSLKKFVVPLFLLYRKYYASALLIKKINDGDYLKGLTQKEKDNVITRTAIVKESSDNLLLNRASNSGMIENGWLILHNGIKVDPFSYYGEKLLPMIMENKGVHEPQEERVFDLVLKNMREGATMLEMGSYWSFYSIWFSSLIKNANTYMIEPDYLNLKYGKINFKANKQIPTLFYQAFVGASSSVDKLGQKTISVDDFVQKYQIPFIDVLHSDIQGYELEMLKGAQKTIEEGKIGYAFISTHSNLLHYQCIEYLKNYGYSIIASADKDQSYSFDGVLVMKAPYYPGIEPVVISIRNKTAKSETDQSPANPK